MNEAELLFTDILHCVRTELYAGRKRILDKTSSAHIASVLKRRISGEPIQYILGKAEFMGLEFKVTPEVLIPRPETEILVETVLKIVASHTSEATSFQILDIGTGSGCIAIALAKFLPSAKIYATDISEKALEIARKNAALNNRDVDFIQSDLFTQHLPAGQEGAIRPPQNLGGRPPMQCGGRNTSATKRRRTPANAAWRARYDIIVSNPPYIPTGEIETLQPEVLQEPRIALDGGKDGLDVYREIIRESGDYLKDSGFLILEMGFNQREDIKNMLQNSGNFEIIEVVKDYSNIDRVIVAQYFNDK